MRSPPYKLQLTKGFFADFSQIARMLAYAVEHGDEGHILPTPTGWLILSRTGCMD